jgi:transcription elongation factor Elf1
MTKTYNSWCETCNKDTNHDVTDDLDTKIQIITCKECSIVFPDGIYHPRVKAYKGFGDKLNERTRRERSEETTETS